MRYSSGPFVLASSALASPSAGICGCGAHRIVAPTRERRWSVSIAVLRFLPRSCRTSLLNNFLQSLRIHRVALRCRSASLHSLGAGAVSRVTRV